MTVSAIPTPIQSSAASRVMLANRKTATMSDAWAARPSDVC